MNNGQIGAIAEKLRTATWQKHTEPPSMGEYAEDMFGRSTRLGMGRHDGKMHMTAAMQFGGIH
ncbi:MAG: hypothetical protein F4X44_07805 [Gammaproteobacteria bacterium]|nr:hypothetical protein [Gammaproteobacteria bacterium]MYD80501.1 hypothetical protein [Gammaproteobacteria bacterium]